MNRHEIYMQRCIDLANNGLGRTFPNPLVGSVIVLDGKIIGEGWHRKYGDPHAEVNAINSVTDKSLLKNATIYVSLEPCSHFGKTPPCSDLIIKSKFQKIVIGTVDPNPIVSGNGIKKLIDAGIDVIVGVLESECNFLNRRFFTNQLKKRPYIILKWAESADGFIAPLTRSEQSPVWISNRYSRQLVHKWRSEEHAILVGSQTVIDDNPQLTIRDWTGENPIRIVLDRNNRISKESYIFDLQAKTIVISNDANPQAFGSDNVTEFATNVCKILYENQISSVIIEGGRQTLQTFIDQNLWDEARVFRGNGKLNTGISAPKFSETPSEKHRIADDELLIFYKND